MTESVQTSPPPGSNPVETIAAFADALRARGVSADSSRVATTVSALGLIDALDIAQVYWAARAALCSGPDDLAHFDALFALWFGGTPAIARAATRMSDSLVVENRDVRAREAAGSSAGDRTLTLAASEADLLRHRPVDTLSASERDAVNHLIALLRPHVATRRSHRYRPGGRERIDISRTVRAMLRDGGELAVIAHRRDRRRPRRLVVLVDVSGSMSPFADAYLRFGHAATQVAPSTTEVFTMGSRLTRVTRPLRVRDPDAALRSAGAAVADWSGGTRLGESMRAFLARWGQRGTARQAIVVIASDGWERGDARLLGEQMAHLDRLAHAIVWVNPHRGKPGFVAATAGMQMALPHIDHLVAGHSLAALSDVVDVIAHA